MSSSDEHNATEPLRLHFDVEYDPVALRRAQMVMLRLLTEVDRVCRDQGIDYWLDAGTLLGAKRHGGFIPWDDDLDLCMTRPDFDRFMAAAQSLPSDIFVQTLETDPEFHRYRTPCKVRDERTQIEEFWWSSTSAHRGVSIDVFVYDNFHVQGPHRIYERALKKLYKALVSYAYAAPHPGARGVRRIKNVVARFKPQNLTVRLLLAVRRHGISLGRRNAGLVDQPHVLGAGFDCTWERYFDPNLILPTRAVEFEQRQFSGPNQVEELLRLFYGDFMALPDPSERFPRHMRVRSV